MLICLEPEGEGKKEWRKPSSESPNVTSAQFSFNTNVIDGTVFLQEATERRATRTGEAEDEGGSIRTSTRAQRAKVATHPPFNQMTRSSLGVSAPQSQK